MGCAASAWTSSFLGALEKGGSSDTDFSCTPQNAGCPDISIIHSPQKQLNVLFKLFVSGFDSVIAMN